MEHDQPSSEPITVEVIEEPTIEPPTASAPSKAGRKVQLILLLFGCIILVLLCGYFYTIHLNSAPANFSSQTITIESGQTAAEIADILAAANIVRSSVLLQGALLYFHDPTKIKATTYTFTAPQTATEVAAVLVTGEFGNNQRRLTFIEGLTVQDYAVIASSLPNVTSESFMAQALHLEGALFPETYFVPETITTEELVTLLNSTHLERLTPYQTQIADNNLSTDEALILASIIEREANTPESMHTVAGIFLNRLAIGMPLQADASIEYVIDTPLGELEPGQLASELRDFDTPYNTYLYPGLPPTPIGNPGEDAIKAIADPLESDYYYYITGDDGQFYYAATYDQHLTHIARHLR